MGIWIIVCIQKETISPLFADLSPTTHVQDCVPR